MRAIPRAIRIAAAGALLIAAPSLEAQGGPPRGPGGMARPAATAAEALPDTVMKQALRVFLDCQGMVRGCDRDFLVQELGFVNFVRDRFDSDVHLLITSLAAGNGGRELTVNFLGQKRFAGKNDTLVVYTLPNDADDRVRRELLRTFQLGLAPYVARTPIASRLRVGMIGGQVVTPQTPQTTKDPWNFWLYRVDGNVRAEGEQLVKNTNLSLSLSAARTTSQWKLNIGTGGSYNERDFKVFVQRLGGGIDTQSVIVLQRASSTNALIGRTLNDHWTLGMKFTGGFSEVLNQKFYARVAPAVEWNYFPWSEATRRQFTVLYTLGGNHYRYYGRTVYGFDDETRGNQSLLFAVSSRQRWGNTNMSLEGSHYLHDPQRNLLTLSGFVDLRLGRGFSLNFRGSASRVRDQIYIAARAQSERDILTQRQQLQTNFRYNMFVGIGYTFGSIYNTIVNQRFGTLGESGRRFGFMGM
jgi:hypothetical protein